MPYSFSAVPTVGLGKTKVEILLTTLTIHMGSNSKMCHVSDIRIDYLRVADVAHFGISAQKPHQSGSQNILGA